MSVLKQIEQIVEQCVQRVLFTAYGAYCPQKMLARFCADVRNHLRSDISNQLPKITMTSLSFLDIHVAYTVDQSMNGIQESVTTLLVYVEADAYLTTYCCTIPMTPQKLNNDDTTLNNVTWEPSTSSDV